MKQKLIIMIVSIFLVLGLSFFIFNTQHSSLTRFAVYNELSENTTQEKTNESIIITKEIALGAISESKDIIKEMLENNFSVNYMNDNLIEAKRVFEQVEYASILREDVNSTEKEKQEAREELRLVKWQNITYADVLMYTEDIKKRKKTAFLLLDRIAVEENKLNKSSKETKAIFEQAKIAFSEERYNDTEKLLEDFNLALEKEESASSTLFGIKNGAMNFFQRYWVQIIIFLIMVSVISYFIYKKLERKLLANKIEKMETEEKVLNDLMKKTQEERFKGKKISGLVYNIRMEKYKERLQEIKEELPVLEERLKSFKNKQNVDK